MPARPLLLAVYDAVRMPPWNESIDAMLMILPPRPACTSACATACARKNGVFRFTFSAASQSSSLNVERIVAPDDAGVVHQDVDAAGGLDRLRDDVGRLVLALEIRMQRDETCVPPP